MDVREAVPDLEVRIRRLEDAIVASPIPDKELPELVSVYGETLAGMLGISRASLRRYANRSRTVPDDVAARAHFIALVTSDLAVLQQPVRTPEMVGPSPKRARRSLAARSARLDLDSRCPGRGHGRGAREPAGWRRRRVLTTVIVFRNVDSRMPFLWEDDRQPAARWHGDGEGPVAYLAETPDGAWRSSSATRRSPTPPSLPESRARSGRSSSRRSRGRGRDSMGTSWPAIVRPIPSVRLRHERSDRVARADSWRRPLHSGRARHRASRPMVVCDPHGLEPSGLSLLLRCPVGPRWVGRLRGGAPTVRPPRSSTPIGLAKRPPSTARDRGFEPREVLRSVAVVERDQAATGAG